MSKEVKNLAASVLDRLRNKAREFGRPFDWMLQYYANERFLYRISQSEHCRKFVLKGGLIFNSWNVPLRRHTKDIDFRALTSSDLESVAQIIKDICKQPVQADAIEYLPETIEIASILEETENPGVRIRLWARIGETTKVRMQIDLGFSDEITPPANIITYPTILDMPAPKLFGYPKETVVAEKLHAIIYRGSMTSRLKDFYDLWFISERFDFEGALLQEAIINTFENRATLVPNQLPEVFADSYAEAKNQQWKAFLNTFNSGESEIQDFSKVLSKLREFLLLVVKAAADGERFDYYWKAGRHWSRE
jgi:predicted nucleotidyltransferase component of viral defense system